MTRPAVSTNFWLRAAFAIAIVYASISGARADTIIPFYTGAFPSITMGNVWGPGGHSVGGLLLYDGSDPNLFYDFSFGAPITNYQETPWCGYGCPQFVTGNIDSGSVSFSGDDSSGHYPPYDFNGNILPGGTFSGEVVCDPISCAWDENVNFSFYSQSGSNGWYSRGSLSLSGGNDGSGGSDYGTLSMVTRATPEPSSILLFGPGIIGLWGVLRRRGKNSLKSSIGI